MKSPSVIPIFSGGCRLEDRGFSLVEIVIALGIFAFCLVAVLGLFTAGLKTERASQDEEGAISTLASLTLAVENSFQNTNGTLSCGTPLEGWTWDPSSITSTNARVGDYAFWVRVQLVKSAGETRLACAHLEVAWPSDGIQWDADGHATGARSSAGSSSFFVVK